jgi:excinuclease ABC subunit C
LNLEEKLKNIPSNPGIYQYFDKDGKLLYIGKAKVLKNRVKSYFRFTPILQPSPTLGPRIHKMISEVADINYIVVDTENDALILENSLIKQLKPKYNILLRDDKTYPYIYFDSSEDFPRLEITRKVLKSKSIKYFGPFSSGARDLLDSIYEIIPLVQKKSCIKGSKACMFYQIKKCKAPCEGKISKKEYQSLLDEALELLNNKSKIIEKLEEKMIFLSEQFRFEEAMVLRDRITTISKSQIKSTLDFAKDEDIDLFSVEIGTNKAVVVKMFIRGGKLISTSHNYINTTEITTFDEIYKTAIVNYYNGELPSIPSSILISDEINEIDELEEFVSKIYNKKTTISYPQRGIKKQLIQVAKNNCLELLKLNTQNKNDSIYEDLKDLFNLYTIPNRFECFDNSQMMGQAKVGAMIVWDGGKFSKDDYRLYNLEANDEYGQMKELLTRRVNKFDENAPPDLWVIDGGETLLKLAYDICDSYGVNLDIIAIAKEKVDSKAYRAKGSAKDILHFKKNNFFESLNLQTSDKRLQFVQRLRDEAHRSAINFHKKQKRREDKQISLLNIHGIGEAKVQKLLNFFGTFEAIENASLEQLESVINHTDSVKIFNFFRKIP